MAIEFVCGSSIDFDAQTGRSSKCEHRFSVDDQKAGAIIECPSCQNFVEVPAAPAQKPQAKPKTRSRASTSVAPSVVSDLGDVDLFEQSVKPVESRLQYDQFPGDTPCRSCGVPLSDSVTECPHCGTSRRAIWSNEPPLDSIEIQLAGCQRWLATTVSEGQTVKTVWVVTNVLVGFLAMSLLAGGFLAGGIVAVIAIALVAFAVLAYWRFCHHTRRIAIQPAARLAIWQQLGWRTVLAYLRMLKWRVPMSTLTNPTVIERRGKPLSGAELANLPGIREADVLDLEGAGITDAGLKYLRGLSDLDYLVLTKNEVSDEGVFRLQQTIPRCWIWY